MNMLLEKRRYTILTNEDYFREIPNYITSIEQCIEDTKTISVDVIGETLFQFDLCYIGFLNRNIYLAEGFIQMIHNRNLTCAGALLRLQLDNCMRLLALNIAEDEQQVVDCILNGDNISKLKDKNGKRMTDGYLKEQLVTYDSQLSNVYNETSGFIHFSSKAFYQSVEEITDDGIRFTIGGELPEKRNEPLIECTQAFIHYYKLFLRFMKSEAEWKKKYDESAEDN